MRVGRQFGVVAGVLLIGIGCSSAVAKAPAPAGPARFATPVRLRLAPGGNTLNDRLGAVACWDAKDCVSAGYDSVGGDANNPYVSYSEVPIAVRETNGRWARAVNLPLPVGAFQPSGSSSYIQNGDLTGLACPAARVCFGVGSYVNSTPVGVPLAESLNGSRWTARELPLPATMSQGNATSISCSSRAQCVAVGTTMGPFNPLRGGPAVPTIWTHSATGWTVTTLPLPAQRDYQLASAALSSVSCPKTGACVVAGSISDSITNGISPVGQTASLPLLLAQAHGRWVTHLLPPPASFPDGLLDAISCTAAGSCVAIGRALTAVQADSGLDANGTPMLISERNGTWGRASTPPVYQDPAPAGGAAAIAPYLSSVACVTTGRCLAMGTYTLLQTRSGWKASAVKLGKQPPQAGLFQQDFGITTIRATACLPTGSCTVVGDNVASGANGSELVASSGAI